MSVRHFLVAIPSAIVFGFGVIPHKAAAQDIDYNPNGCAVMQNSAGGYRPGNLVQHFPNGFCQDMGRPAYVQPAPVYVPPQPAYGQPYGQVYVPPPVAVPPPMAPGSAVPGYYCDRPVCVGMHGMKRIHGYHGPRY